MMRKMIDARLELRLQEYEPQQPACTVPVSVRIPVDAAFLQQSVHRPDTGRRTMKRYRH